MAEIRATGWPLLTASPSFRKQLSGDETAQNKSHLDEQAHHRAGHRRSNVLQVALLGFGTIVSGFVLGETLVRYSHFARNSIQLKED